MAGRIFINYRRGDDAGHSGRLFDRLQEVFAPEQLFMDVDNIEPGLDFVNVLKEQVAQCDVLIAVIGKSWIDARDEAGLRRLDNPTDFVRVEIESALAQDKRVIPVLVGDARLPRADELPEAMKPLATRNAVRLTHERFRADAQGLITALQRALKSADDARAAQPRAGADKQSAVDAGTRVEAERPARAPRPTGVIATATVLALAVAGAIVYSSYQPAQPPAIAVGKLTVVPPDEERALKPRDTFRECTNCPEMVVAPAGSFAMGSPATEAERYVGEEPQHSVTIARQFAISRFALTFDEWDACVGDGGCNGYKPGDQGWGRGRRPVIYVSWDDANAYVAWLATKTGKSYRLLTDAEHEYAARAGTQTAYPWGNAIGNNNANCNGCGSQWDNKQTAPVGSFAANGFGLYDMMGNVWQWTEDCWNNGYNGAPGDGSAWLSGDCSLRVIRGASWYQVPRDLRSANRNRWAPVMRDSSLGFRVARTLLTP
jgi:formylglycine-generating enzyme required for sulfatase activity